MEKKLKRRVGQKSLPLAIGMGMVLSLAIALALLMVMALILYRTQDPTAYIGVLSLIPLGIGGFLCGVLCTKLWGHPSPVPSLVGGCLLALLVLSAGLCIPGSTLSFGVRLGACPCIALLSLFGGLLCLRPRRGRRRRRS